MRGGEEVEAYTYITFYYAYFEGDSLHSVVVLVASPLSGNNNKCNEKINKVNALPYKWAYV